MKTGRFYRAVSGILLAAMVVCGCGRSEAEPEKKEEAEVTTKAESDAVYRISRHEINGTYFYDVVRRDNVSQAPIVFFLHGLNDDKEEIADYARTLADAGYTAVVPDAAGHGESKTEEVLDFFDIVQETAVSCNEILAFYQNSDYADISRFSISGISMGGITALYYGAYSENRPQCIVSICGTPDWGSLLGSEEIYVQFQDGIMSSIGDAEAKKAMMIKLLEASPDNQIEYLLQIPILMINGEEDTLVPVSGVKAFEARAELYPNQLTCVIAEGRGHDIGDGDVDQMMDFLKEHMPAEP